MSGCPTRGRSVCSESQVCHDEAARVKTAWYPQFSAEPLKRLDKKIGSPTREPLKRVLTHTAPSWPTPSSFTSTRR
ncbi:protein of unknown function (plasmid) [Shinella sp. WSC3-e]|nr:hypothetical protein SHINE37_70109 [Rhizobiaceae bacterium]CAK7260942.1 protein of unknown function [Shinella sp. WSC3-e]